MLSGQNPPQRALIDELISFWGRGELTKEARQVSRGSTSQDGLSVSKQGDFFLLLSGGGRARILLLFILFLVLALVKTKVRVHYNYPVI